MKNILKFILLFILNSLFGQQNEYIDSAALSNVVSVHVDTCKFQLKHPDIKYFEIKFDQNTGEQQKVVSINLSCEEKLRIDNLADRLINVVHNLDSIVKYSGTTFEKVYIYGFDKYRNSKVLNGYKVHVYKNGNIINEYFLNIKKKPLPKNFTIQFSVPIEK